MKRAAVNEKVMGKVQREQRRNKNKCHLLLKDGDTTTNYDADSICINGHHGDAYY